MKKTIRLTESELTRLIKRIVSENKPPIKNVIDIQTGMQVGTHQYGVGFTPNKIGMDMGYEPHPTSIPNGTKMDRSSMEDRIFKPRDYDRLSESVIKRIVSENEHHEYAKMNHGEFMNEIDSLCKEASMIEDANCSEINDMEHKWNLLDRAHNSHGVDRSDDFMLCGAKIRRFKKNRCTPRENEPRPMRLRGDGDEDRWSQYK